MELLEIVRNKPMFENFTEEEIIQFSKIEFSTKRFKKGEIIFREGEIYSSLYLLVQGTVSINRIGFDHILMKLSPGDLFGEISFLSKTPRHSTVIAEEDVSVIIFDDSFFQKISRSMENKIKIFFIDLLLSRLFSINKTLVRMGRYSVGHNVEL